MCIVCASSCSRPPAAVDPEAYERRLQAGKKLLDERKLAESLSELKKAQESDPSKPEPFLLRSRILEASGRFKDALDEAAAAHKLRPNDPAILMTEIQLGAGFVPPSETEALARQAIALSPDSADAQLILGRAIVAQEKPSRYPEAMKAFQDANAISPTSSTPLLELGKLYLRIGDIPRAQAMLQNSVRLLDAQVSPGRKSITEIEGWVADHRASAFALVQVYEKTGMAGEARNERAAAAKWSERAAELRRLKNRSSANPPDKAANSKLEAIAEKGPAYWGK